MNQAEQLLQFNRSWNLQLNQLKTIAITSGKGGVGKTNVVLNLSLALAERGLKVGILDADFGLGNIDILLGLDAKLDIDDLLAGRATLEQILIHKSGLQIIPATSGTQALTHLSPQQEGILFQELRKLEQVVDLLIIDTAAGISDNVISLLLSADEVFLVVSPEPTSIVDAYAVIKVVSEIDPFKKFLVLANMVENEADASDIFMKLSRAAQKFLNKGIEYLGYVKRDRNLTDAVRLQKPIIEHMPESKSSRDFYRLAQQLGNRIPRRQRRQPAQVPAEKP